MFKKTNKTNLSLLVTKHLLLGFRFILFWVALAGVFLYTRASAPTRVYAATNSELNFQARLLNSAGAIVPDGYYNVEFRLYNVSSGGTALWTETYYDSNGVTAGNDNRVQVKTGYLSVHLGSLTSFPGSIAWDQDLYLTMNIGGTTQTATPTYDGEMTPRLKLTAIPYAFRAAQLAKLTGGDTSTLDFATQTGARSILLPDESGTLCIQASANCSFAPASGSGNYIQNGTSVQTANFYIQSAAAGSRGGVIRAASGQTADLLTFFDSAGTTLLASFNKDGSLGINSFNPGATGTAYTRLGIQAGDRTGLYILAPNTSSHKSIQVTNSSQTATLFVVNHNGELAITPTAASSTSGNGTSASAALAVTGAAGQATTGTTGQTAGNGGGVSLTGGAGGTAPSGSANGNGGTITMQGGAPGAGAGTAASYGNILLQQSGGNVGIGTGSPSTKLDVNGNTNITGTLAVSSTINSQTISSAANFTGTITIQGASALTLGTASVNDGAILFKSSGGANTITLAAPATNPTSSYSLMLPTAGPSTSQCLKTDSVTASQLVFGTCGASGNFVTLQASSPGTPDTGHVNVSGTIIAGTSVLTPLLDTPSGTTILNIGTNNATTGINLNQNTVLAAGKSLTVTGGNTASRPGSPTEGMVYYDTTTKRLLIYANGKWQADRTEATKIVAASNSSQIAKDAADYIADGTGDESEINAALTAAAGGVVYLIEGTYTISTSISVPNNTMLAGAGRGTVVQFADIDTTDNMIENSDTSTGAGVVIRDLKLDGRDDLNTADTSNGIYLNGMGDTATNRQGGMVSGVIFERLGGTGITITSSSDSNTVQDSSFINNDRWSTTIAVSVSGINNNIAGNYLMGNSTGIRGAGSGNVISNNTLANNSWNGIELTSTTGNTVANNTVDSSTIDGINLSSSSKNTITGNKLSSNGGSGINLATSHNNAISNNQISNSRGSTLNDGIKLSASDTNIISNNYITDSSATTNNYAINISNSTSDTNYLADNVFDTGATINDAGTGTVYANQSRAANGGQLTVRTANDTAAFQIQKASAADTLFTADTTNNKLVVGNATGTDANTTLLVLDSATADPTTGYNGAQYYNTTSNKFRCYENGAWTNCIAGAGVGSGVDLQGAYDNSGTTDPQILLDAAYGGIKIQDGTTPVTGNLFQLSSNGGGSTYFGVSATSINLGLNTTVASGQTFTVNSGATALTGASGGTALSVTNSTAGTGTIATFKDNTSAVMTIADGGFITLQPTANLTDGQTHIIQNATFANATGSGIVRGYQQNITVSSSTAANNKGFEINVVDSNTTIAHINKGLEVNLSGTNTSQIQVGIDSIVNRGTALRATSNGIGGVLSCNGANLSSAGLCAVSSYTGTGALGISGATYGRNSTGILDATASGVYGTALGSGTGGNFYTGVKGYAIQVNNAAYTSIGVLGASAAGTGATVYGGYFTIDAPINSATNGAVLFANNSTAGVKILQVQDNGSDVFVVEDGGTVKVTTLGTANTNTILCRNTSNQLATCSATPATDLQTAYNGSGTTNPQILLSSTNGGIKIRDGSPAVSGNLLQIQNNGGTATYLGISASALTLQDSSGNDALIFDSTTSELKVYANATSPTKYARIYYDDSANEAVFSASSGTTRIGSGTGNVTISLTNNSEKFDFSHTGTNAGSTDIDFSIKRDITGTTNNLQGNVVKIEDLSTFTSGSSAPNLLYINQNNTAATGNLILAQTGAATDKFKVTVAGAVTAAGSITIGSGQSYTGAGAVTVSSTSANLTLQAGGANKVIVKPGTDSSSSFEVQNSAGTALLTVDTENSTDPLAVRIGVSDTTGTLLVLDTKTDSGDPTPGINGAMYYNSSSNKFRCYEGGVWKNCIGGAPAVRSFIDSTSDAAVDADTTNYWDTAAENNNAYPNFTPAQTSTTIMGIVTLEVTATGTQDTEITGRVERGIGSVPTCGSGTAVGGLPGVFATNTSATKSSTIHFIDNPNTTSTVYYVLCSDVATVGTGANITRIRITLQEVSNSN